MCQQPLGSFQDISPTGCCLGRGGSALLRVKLFSFTQDVNLGVGAPRGNWSVN